MTIKEMRMKSRLTQKEFAEIIGCSYRTVQEWERERRECPKWVKKLIKYYLLKEKYI